MTKSRSLKEWESYILPLSKSTRESYNRNLNKFLEYFSISHEDLYQLKLKSTRSEDPRDGGEVEKMVNEVIHHEIEEKGNLPSTAKHIDISVNAFLVANGLSLKRSLIKTPRSTPLGVEKITKQEILDLIDYGNTNYPFRYRALFLFLKDSGLSISDVLRLNVENFRNAIKYYNDKNEIFLEFNPIRRKKTGEIGYPCIGPEAVNALNRYLEKREQEGLSNKSSSPLFINNRGKRLSQTNVRLYIRTLRENIPSIKRRLGSHSFRKFHFSELVNDGMNTNIILKLQAKKLHGSDSAYDLSHEISGGLINNYMKHYNAIRVFEFKTELDKLRNETDKRITDLERDNKKMIESHDRLIEELNKLSDLKRFKHKTDFSNAVLLKEDEPDNR